MKCIPIIILILAAPLSVYYFTVGIRFFSEYTDAYENKAQFLRGLIPFHDWIEMSINQFKQLK